MGGKGLMYDLMFNVWYINTFMNNFFQQVVPALQNFYDKRFLNLTSIHLFFLDISTTNTNVGDPIIKLKLGE